MIRRIRQEASLFARVSKAVLSASYGDLVPIGGTIPAFKRHGALKRELQRQKLSDAVIVEMLAGRVCASLVTNLEKSASMLSPTEFYSTFLDNLEKACSRNEFPAFVRMLFVPGVFAKGFGSIPGLYKLRDLVDEGTARRVDVLQVLSRVDSLFGSTEGSQFDFGDARKHLSLLMPAPGPPLSQRTIQSMLVHIHENLRRGGLTASVWVVAPKKTIDYPHLVEIEAALVAHGCRFLFVQAEKADKEWLEKLKAGVASYIRKEKYLRLSIQGGKSLTDNEVEVYVSRAYARIELPVSFFNVQQVNFAFYPRFEGGNRTVVGIYHDCERLEWMPLGLEDTKDLIEKIKATPVYKTLAPLIPSPDAET